MARILRDRLQDPAVEIVSDAALSNAHSWVSQASNELLNAINSGNPQVLLANNAFLPAVDAFSQSLGMFPFSQPGDVLAGQLDEAQRRVATIHDLQLKAAADSRAAQDQHLEYLRQSREQIDQQLEAAKSQRDAAATLLAALGGDATSKGYAETASTEQTSADNWRKVTFVLGIVTAVVALLLFTVAHAPGWEATLRRSAVTLPFIVLTLYAGRQAAEHRREEREARRLQLSFGSVNSYLADLDEVRRADLKTQLSARLFSSRSEGDAQPMPAGFPSSAELVQMIIEGATRGRSS